MPDTDEPITPDDLRGVVEIYGDGLIMCDDLLLRAAYTIEEQAGRIAALESQLAAVTAERDAAKAQVEEHFELILRLQAEPTGIANEKLSRVSAILAPLRELHERATPGPWVHSSAGTLVEGFELIPREVSPVNGAETVAYCDYADADFIAAARGAIADLLAVVPGEGGKVG